MGIKKIIAVASAKGGVGKSSICANLACMFSKNFRVGILDADIYGPNQHIIFDVSSLKPELIEVEGKKKFLPVQVNNISINSMGFILD
ncbi:MAG: Mrp/NBP35 family ATP-binding protein, partial [SAR86 cluster bacterium]|nr:Mrp/NBP35 family ATP-binding protein [SAR86 cluster bacterium]